VAIPRTYSQYAQDAALLLGEHIKLARKRHKWSEHALAERAGIARAALQKIESGDLGCAIGLFFEVAALVSINLFEQDSSPLAKSLEQVRDKIALLPKRIRAKTRVIKDDF
jgi:transcriptional regulator with XRE-family HTH domain